jgi:hypothetical protein
MQYAEYYENSSAFPEEFITQRLKILNTDKPIEIKNVCLTNEPLEVIVNGVVLIILEKYQAIHFKTFFLNDTEYYTIGKK